MFFAGLGHSVMSGGKQARAAVVSFPQVTKLLLCLSIFSCTKVAGVFKGPGMHQLTPLSLAFATLRSLSLSSPSFQ